MVREFDREPSGDLWLIVDMDADVQAGRDAEATQEYAVILAASLAGQFARSGERHGVGLLISGRNPQMLPPARGRRSSGGSSKRWPRPSRRPVCRWLPC